jgi:hypothetical protein
VQHTAEDLGPFHEPYLAGTYFPFTCILSLLLLALPITMFAGHGKARRVTITEAVWVGTTFLSDGDYEVKWGGLGLVQVSFLRGNKMIVTARAAAAVAAGPHDRAIVKIQAISENSKALEGIVWKDVSLTFDTIHPFWATLGRMQSIYWCQYAEWRVWIRHLTLCYRKTRLHTIFPGNVPSLSGPRFVGKIARSMKASTEAWSAL